MFSNLQERMQQAVVWHFLKPDSGHHIYQLVAGKLVKMSAGSFYDKAGAYVVYPERGRPAAHIFMEEKQ